MDKEKCFICDKYAKINIEGNVYFVDCSSCGKFSIGLPALDSTPFFQHPLNRRGVLEPNFYNFALKVILNKIWQSNRIANEYYPIDKLYVGMWDKFFIKRREQPDTRLIYQQLIQEYTLEIAQQVNNLILFIGDANNKGDPFPISFTRGKHYYEKPVLSMIISCKIGSFDVDKLSAHYSYLERKEMVYEGKLTTEGWIEYDKLNTGKLTNIAFMAMKFGEKDSNTVFEHFKNIIQEKFSVELIRLDRAPQSGLIDMHLRNKIRSSRFIISDLSHQNNGAYWEAGFAEGLGKVVIYSCEKSKEENIHFDVRNLYRINYNLKAIEQSSEDLINVIEASIPDLLRKDTKK